MIGLATYSTLLAQQTPSVLPAAGGQSSLLLWAIVMLAAGATLLVVEVFVPSGGLIAAAAALCLVVGIIMFFGVNTYLGLVTSGVLLVATPFLLVFAMKIWPYTPIGRRLVLGGVSGGASEGNPGVERPGAPGLAVGAVGRAATDLRPVGTGVFEGQRLECLAEHGLIGAGTAIEIVASHGMEIKVREIPAKV